MIKFKFIRVCCDKYDYFEVQLISFRCRDFEFTTFTYEGAEDPLLQQLISNGTPLATRL